VRVRFFGARHPLRQLSHRFLSPVPGGHILGRPCIAWNVRVGKIAVNKELRQQSHRGRGPKKDRSSIDQPTRRSARRRPQHAGTASAPARLRLQGGGQGRGCEGGRAYARGAHGGGRGDVPPSSTRPSVSPGRGRDRVDGVEPGSSPSTTATGRVMRSWRGRRSSPAVTKSGQAREAEIGRIRLVEAALVLDWAPALARRRHCWRQAVVCGCDQLRTRSAHRR
jgi:hypothetical protein